MFSPYSKTPISSVKAQQKLNKPSPLFSPSIRRSLTPGFSRNSSFGLSFDISAGDLSADQLVAYESTLPVLITEAITLAERSSDISVKLEPFGYASLVCGRQLFIWKYKPDSDKCVTHCRELTLPQSDLAHKADLVHLFQTEDSNLPSAVAVSPEGHVRYWPNINHEGSSVDAQPDLQGQECCSLTSIYPLGCVLATTSSSLVILTPTIVEGQPNVICRPLALPLGVLAGISRKMSSFFFASIPSQTAETKQLNRVVSLQSNEDHFLYVLSTNTLQKWVISKRKENSDQLLFETDLDPLLKQAYADELRSSEPTSISRLKTWSIDMQLCSSGVVIFAAGAVLARPGESVHYSFGVLEVDEPPKEFSTFSISKYCEPYQENVEERTLNYKLLLPSLDSSSAYIYNLVKALCFQYKTPQSDFSEVDFSNSENAILGSGTCDGTPLFFTKFFGIVSFQPNKTAIGDSRLLESMKEFSVMQTEPSEASESLSSKLRAAMYAYIKNDNEKSQPIISDLLSNPTQLEKGNLDEAVIGLDLGIIDDYPVSDPRWCESVPTASVSTSLIISYQLEDKLTVHNYLMNFLKAFNLLEKLSTSRVADFKIPTNVLLCEHAEKIVAAKAIRMFLTDHLEIIEFAVRDALDRQGKEVKNHLTPQDVFFREVSAFHAIFPSLIDWEMEQINADQSVSQTLYALMTINKIFVGLLEAINEYRSNSREIYNLQNSSLNAEYLPWTSRDGNSGIRMHIKKQLEINTKHFTNLTDNIQIQGVLYQQYVVMLDFYLSTYKSHLDSLDKEQASNLKKEFVNERSNFLKPLVEIGQHERAAAIAEKYLDFDILNQICNDTKNVDRLQRYMHQFSEHNFSEFVFKWYLDKGKKSKLFDKHLGQREVLGDFLKDHDSLKWIYYIQYKKYDSAHATLKQLALKETEFLNRKKTLLSLSKLCAMISDVNAILKTNLIKGINLELDLIAHQESLPLSIVEACGINPKNMRVFPPEELIEMYVADENSTGNAYDFKIALDILNFIKKPSDDPEVFSLRMHIWAKAIQRDNWETLDINNPLDAVKETVFFQIIELAFNEGIDIHDFMPHIEDLLQVPELYELVENPSFKFLLQAGYEYILKIID